MSSAPDQTAPPGRWGRTWWWWCSCVADIRGKKIESGDIISPDSIKQGKNHIEYSDVLARLSNLAMKYRQIR
jgi:hypothetical protein